MKNYRKSIVAGGGVLTAVGAALADGTVDTTEVGLIATAVAVLVGVFFAPNTPDA